MYVVVRGGGFGGLDVLNILRWCCMMLFGVLWGSFKKIKGVGEYYISVVWVSRID